LNQFTNSGRYFVDTEKEINDEVTDYISASQSYNEHVFVIPNSSLEDYQEILKEANEKLFNIKNTEQLNLSEQQITTLVESAIMAPSGGNVQPWKWIYRNKTLLLFNDINRSESILNYKKTASLISLGAATENLLLKAKQLKIGVSISKFPLGDDNDLICSFQFQPLIEKKEIISDNLVSVIPTRLTNRNLSIKVELHQEYVDYFNSIVETIPGAKLKLFTENKKLEEIKNIIAEVDKLFMTNKAGHTHFIHEIRWNKKEVEQTRDGIDINTLDLTPTERAGLIVSKNWNVTKHIKKWNLGNEFGKLSRKAIDSSSALGMITMPKFSSDCYFDGGRAVQKMWLAATKTGIAFQPISINTFLFAKVGDNNFDDINEIKSEMIDLYGQLKSVCNINQEKDIFLFRLAVADEPKIKALRRNLSDVLIYEK